MQWAHDNNVAAEGFVSITDSETYMGNRHVSQHLRRHRERFGPTKHIVIGMTAINLTVNDPLDADGLDVVGFDASVPQAIGEFLR